MVHLKGCYSRLHSLFNEHSEGLLDSRLVDAFDGKLDESLESFIDGALDGGIGVLLSKFGLALKAGKL